MILRFVFAVGFLLLLGTVVLWAPVVGLTPGEAFVWTVIAACVLWLGWHVVDFVRICITGGW